MLTFLVDKIDRKECKLTLSLPPLVEFRGLNSKSMKVSPEMKTYEVLYFFLTVITFRSGHTKNMHII